MESSRSTIEFQRPRFTAKITFVCSKNANQCRTSDGTSLFYRKLNQFPNNNKCVIRLNHLNDTNLSSLIRFNNLMKFKTTLYDHTILLNEKDTKKTKTNMKTTIPILVCFFFENRLK